MGDHRTDWATTYPLGCIYSDRFPSGISSRDGHPATNGHVVIDNDVWISNNVTIMSGIHLGSGSVIAANSVVTRGVKPYSIVGGNPARIIRVRFSEQLSSRLLKLAWWNHDDETIDKLIPLLQQPLTDGVMAALTKACS